MKSTVISQFQGIAPRYDPDLRVDAKKEKGWARIAQNIDLSSGKIKALLDNLLKEADTNLYNSLTYYNSAWVRGNDRYFCQWPINDLDLLFYLDGGTIKKRVGSSVADLGQTRPGPPTTALNGVGVIEAGDYTYIITTTRSVGGHIDESGPSAESIELSADTNTITVTRPTITDPDVTHWNIYRYIVATGDYQFIAQVPIATTFYDDNTANADVGDAISTWYISDQGNNIVFDKPLAGVEGLTTEPHGGMLFFWIGPTLLWTEPGYPDAAPSFYNMNFPAKIKRVIPIGGIVAILTEIGPFRIDGTHPELLQQSKLLGNEPCVGTAACKTIHGIAYLCDSGIALFDLSTTTVISDEPFTEKWFESNVLASGAHIVENDNIFYLFHSRGTLVVDIRVSPAIWTTLTLIAHASFKNELDGKLYIIDADGIKEIQGASTYLTWSWRSGNILMDTPLPKEFQSVEIIGSGTDIVLTLYLDDIQKATKTIGFDMEDDRTLKMPEGERGKALQFLVSGTGEIKEVIVRSADE